MSFYSLHRRSAKELIECFPNMELISDMSDAIALAGASTDQPSLGYEASYATKELLTEIETARRIIANAHSRIEKLLTPELTAVWRAVGGEEYKDYSEDYVIESLRAYNAANPIK